jgi:hypothetical protein
LSSTKRLPSCMRLVTRSLLSPNPYTFNARRLGAGYARMAFQNERSQSGHPFVSRNTPDTCNNAGMRVVTTPRRSFASFDPAVTREAEPWSLATSAAGAR